MVTIMKYIYLLFVVFLFTTCKKKDEPAPKDPSFIYAKSVELYFNQEIPEGAKLYIDDLVFTTKTFYGATKDSGRYDLQKMQISSTTVYNGATEITDKETKMVTAGKSLFNILYKFTNANGESIYKGMPTPYSNVPSYIKLRITADAKELRIKTENYNAQITIIK
jgi:hypothetical protein